MDGTACEDGLFCTVGETCNAGSCVGGLLNLCDDVDQCTVDSCDEAGNVCVNATAPMDGQPCDDGLYCNIGETCLGGVCQGGAANLCDDGNFCTQDSCDEAGGACVNDAAAMDGTACEDGLFCTAGEACNTGACVGGLPNECDDGEQCTQDSCDDLTDICVNATAPMDGQPCDDGDACTENDVCSGGACAGTAITCDDENPCTDDSCDPSTGCLYTENTAVCDDGDVCTVGDACSGGTCAGTASDCSALNDACNMGVCDPATGECEAQPVANDTPCDDGDECTEGEACQEGVCTGGTDVCVTGVTGGGCSCRIQGEGPMSPASLALLAFLSVLAITLLRQRRPGG